MGAQLNFTRTIKAIALGTISAVLASVAHGQQLNLTSNQFTVSVPSTSFSSTVSVSNTGTVGAVTGVPTTGSLTTPSFSFTLQGTAINSTSGTYTVGIILDEQGSQRRLEIYIPGVSLSFDGSGNLTGTLTTPSVTIYGRDGAGTLTAEVTAANGGSVAFNGNSISFSAADQISFIQAQGGILADITTSINNTGLTYDYTLILANTAGTNYAFEHSDGTDFPATVASEFTLVPASNAAENTVLATNGQKLTGTVAFSAGGGGGGGGGGSSETQSNEEINNALNQLANTDLTDPSNATPAVIAQVESLVQDSAANANSVANSLAAGSANANDGLDAANTIASVFDASGDLTQSGNPQSTSNLVNSLSSVTNVFNLITTGGALNTSQKATLQSTAESLATGLAKNIGSTLSETDSRSIASALGDTLSSVLKAGGSLSPTLITNVREAAGKLSTAAQAALTSKFPQLATNTRANTSLKLQTSAQPFKGVCPSGTVPDSFLAAFTASLGGVPITCVADSAGLLGPADQSAQVLALISANSTAESLIAEALGGNATVVDVPASGRTDITVNGELYPTRVINFLVVDDSTADGTTVLDNGAALLVKDGAAFVTAPAAKDFAALSSGLSTAFSATVTRNNTTGSLVLENSSIKASVTFAFENAADTSGPTGSVTFTETSTNPADPGYKIVVQYSDGSSQSLLPYVAENNFIDSLQLLGTLPLIDRSTGVVDIDGLLVKPDVVVRPLLTSEQTFLDINQDANGVAFTTTGDMNGDGTTDYLILSDEGAQVLYAVP
jgi:hypothetical protein